MELEAADEDLFIDFGTFADFEVWGIEDGGGADLDVGADADEVAADDGEEADGGVGADGDGFADDDGADAEGDSGADLVSEEAIDPSFDGGGEESEGEDVFDGESRLIGEHGRGWVGSRAPWGGGGRG